MAKTKIKLLILGDAGVGKTSLLIRYTDHCFSVGGPPALGEDFRQKEVTVDGESVTLEIWDTCGEERFRTITSSYYRGARAVLLAYDTTSKESLLNLHTWLEEVKKLTDAATIAIVGCKADMLEERQVSQVEVEEMFATAKIPLFETSAKTGANGEAPFMHVIKETMHLMKSTPETPADVFVLIGGAHAHQKKKKKKKKKNSSCALF